MANSSYINYEAIKNDINLDGKKFFAIIVTAALIFGANCALNLNEKIDSDEKTIDEMITSLASLQEQVNQNKKQIQEQTDALSVVTSTNTNNIILLAANTNTKVAAVKRSVAALTNDVVAVSDKVSVVEKKALSIEERTRAIEQAVDMPGANPLDSLITNYEQE